MGENYGRKMIHGAMKAKGIKVCETKTGQILCNPKSIQKHKEKGRTLPATC